jgi:hypothetical protein
MIGSMNESGKSRGGGGFVLTTPSLGYHPDEF